MKADQQRTKKATTQTTTRQKTTKTTKQTRASQPQKAVSQVTRAAKPDTPPTNDPNAWWEAGIRFECQGSGQCCVSHGEYGFVWMTLEDRRRMAQHLGLTTTAFTRKYCEMTDGLYRLKDGTGEACFFLKEKRCSVYPGRPTQCRTWPFWPEVMNAKTWTKEVAAFCPGVGKGRVWKAEEIRKNLDEQKRSEEILVGGG